MAKRPSEGFTRPASRPATNHSRVPDGPDREALFRRLVAQQYERGSAINMAQALEVDAVIDPAETRAWLVAGLESGQVRPTDGTLAIDTW
jgi:acetyl-CoA carboxylase carboxyltransferase component